MAVYRCYNINDGTYQPTKQATKQANSSSAIPHLGVGGDCVGDYSLSDWLLGKQRFDADSDERAYRRDGSARRRPNDCAYAHGQSARRLIPTRHQERHAGGRGDHGTHGSSINHAGSGKSYRCASGNHRTREPHRCTGGYHCAAEPHRCTGGNCCATEPHRCTGGNCCATEPHRRTGGNCCATEPHRCTGGNHCSTEPHRCASGNHCAQEPHRCASGNCCAGHDYRGIPVRTTERDGWRGGPGILFRRQECRRRLLQGLLVNLLP